MATGVEPIISRLTQSYRHLRGQWKTYVSGVFVLIFILGLYGQSLISVWSAGDGGLTSHWWQDPYLHQVLYFSFGQASLSAFLSVFIGAIFARAFFYQSFPGKHFLLPIFSLTFVLPSLVAIFGILGVYGASGWFAKIAQFFGLDWQFSIYGLTGILIAHLFFNIPLATKMFLQSYQAIPAEQHKLAAQLNLRGWHFVKWVELPYLRPQLLPSFMLIFMLCFTSFAIVLVLGGGPKYTSFEVAIYQAIIFDFDLPKATLFAIFQFILCFVLFAISQIINRTTEMPIPSQGIWQAKQSTAVKFGQVFIISVVALFLLLPLINTVSSALFSDALGDILGNIWTQKSQWKPLLRAMAFSFSIAPLSAIFALIMATGLLLTSRRLHYWGLTFIANGMLHFTFIVLAVPMLILAMGLFLAFREWHFSTEGLFILIVICNGVTALPFVIRILTAPMNNNMDYYDRLCQSLGITGWQRFRLIEWHKLAQPVKYAFALACCLSLGDFTAIALFGNQDFSSLPYLLYQQLGSYRGDDASVTALVLLVSCLGMFILMGKEPKRE